MRYPSILIACTAVMLGAGDADPLTTVPLAMYPELRDTAFSATVVTPAWPAGIVATVDVVLPQAFPPGARTPTDHAAAMGAPLPAVLGGVRAYSAKDHPARGFPDGDGFIDTVIASDTDHASAWYPIRADVASGAFRNWSWDGSTCFAWLSDKTVRLADGRIAWQLPADLRTELEAGANVAVWGRSTLPRPCAVARFVPGTVANNQIGMLEMRGAETASGAVTFTLAWLNVTVAGVERLPMATSPALPTDLDAFDLCSEVTSSARWAWCPTGVAVVEIERAGHDGPGKVTAQVWIPSGGKLVPKLVSLGKGHAPTIHRYRDGYLALVDVRVEGGEVQVVGVAGDAYPFRQITDRATRLAVLDAGGSLIADWLLPGRWECSPQRMRGDVVALVAQASQTAPGQMLTTLCNPLTGSCSPKGLVGDTPVLDAIWQGQQVALVTLVPELERPTWLGDVTIVSQALGITIPTTAQILGDVAAGPTPTRSVIGRWQIVEGPGNGQFVEFLQDGLWTSPWGDFTGRWTSTAEGLAMTSNRPVTATMLADGRMRIAANVTLVIQRTP